MKRRQFLSIATALGVSGITCQQFKPDYPNIVFILADDMGRAQLGCYGSVYYETPNIDRLASEGKRFTDAYAASPVCSPTRASILTGKYPARLHLTNFIAGDGTPPEASFQVPDWQKYLPLREKTLPEYFKEAGYHTAHFGKWHLSKEKMPPHSLTHNPEKQGYDVSFVTYKPVPPMAQPWQTPENDAHNVRMITEKALDFITHNKNHPFFVMLSHNSIHNPLMEKATLVQKYREKPEAELSENHAVHGAMIETLDKSIGDLVAHLGKLNIMDNTMVVFCSDNGGLESEADQTPLRSGKASVYEGGIRIPLIIRWDGYIKAGSVSHVPVSSIDFLPTFCDLLNIKYPDQKIDGESLKPVLFDNQSINRESLFWHFPHYHGSGEGPCAAVRKGNYKLIRWFDPAFSQKSCEYELFNLASDIGETTDLAQKEPDNVKALSQALQTWLEKVDAQMLKQRE